MLRRSTANLKRNSATNNEEAAGQYIDPEEASYRAKAARKARGPGRKPTAGTEASSYRLYVGLPLMLRTFNYMVALREGMLNNHNQPQLIADITYLADRLAPRERIPAKTDGRRRKTNLYRIAHPDGTTEDVEGRAAAAAILRVGEASLHVLMHRGGGRYSKRVGDSYRTCVVLEHSGKGTLGRRTGTKDAASKNHAKP